MSAAADQDKTDNALSSSKTRRRERKRKAGRGTAEAVQRRAAQVVAGAVGLVFLLLIGSSIARALRPEKAVESPRAPLIVASNTKPREAEKPAAPIIVPWSQSPGPQAPVFAPPPAEDAD